MRKIGYFALCLYFLLVGLAGLIPNLLIPSTLLAGLALLSSFGIFIDLCLPTKDKRPKSQIF